MTSIQAPAPVAYPGMPWPPGGGPGQPQGQIQRPLAPVYLGLRPIVLRGRVSQARRHRLVSAGGYLQFVRRAQVALLRPRLREFWQEQATRAVMRLEERSGKSLHEWQQAQAPARYWIERLTEPGGVVFDPFTGSGTFLVAAKASGRQYLGFEVDSGHVRDARQRLAGTLITPRLIEDEEESMCLPGFSQVTTTEGVLYGEGGPLTPQGEPVAEIRVDRRAGE